MRELKFRAWSTYEKKMYSPAFPSWNGGIEVWENNIPQSKVDWLGPGPAEPEGVLMQFTGLKDKNGKEIWEGDIVSGWRKGSNSDRSYTGILEWNIQQCGFVIRCGKFIMEILSLAMSGGEDGTRLDSFEVVGNIYEHANLLTP